MDEEEKPFDIFLIVILLIVAIGNDIAEVFFDLLSFTGVGLVGEAIMEPINFLLDLFFTGVFVWRVGWGGGTISQYIGDLLQLTFIPGRTISVVVGIWISNHPSSVVGKIATEAAALESGKVGGSLDKEVEGAASKVGQETRGLGESGEGQAGGGSREKTGSSGASNTKEEVGGESAEEMKPQEKDEMADPNEGNPVEELQEELLEESNQEKSPQGQEPQEEREEEIQTETSTKVIDIQTGRKPQQKTEAENENIDKAA